MTHLPSWVPAANDWSVGRGRAPKSYVRTLMPYGCELPTLTGESVLVWLSAHAGDATSVQSEISATTAP